MRKRDSDKIEALSIESIECDRAKARLDSHREYVRENPSCDHVGKWQGGKCPDPRCFHGSGYGQYLDVAEYDGPTCVLDMMQSPITVQRSRYIRQVVLECTGSNTPPTKRYFWMEC